VTQDTQEETQRGHTPTKIYLNICSVVFVILIPLLLRAAFFSFMLVRNINSRFFIWTFIIGFFLAPVFTIVCSCRMWVCYKRKQYGSSVMWSLSPFLYLLFLCISISFAESFTLLDRYKHFKY
jgi:hypothetical protein